MSTSKTFRLFISSTFNDFRREREILQTKIFPEIKSYASSLGYAFQPIDLRWGVSNEAQLDQKTLALCLNEVSACKSHPHPNFLIMAGDRYGWVPLPYAIEKNEYELLLKLMSQEEQSKLGEWYKIDQNQIPASYILKERSGEFEEYGTWAVVENSLREILQRSVTASSLSEEQKRKYFLSATEAEVEEGIIPYLNETKKQQELLAKNPQFKDIDPDYIFGFFRDIDPSTQQSDKFITQDYEKAQRFKKRIGSVLSEFNVLHASTKQLDTESLDESYLSEFETRMFAFLKSQIDAQKAKDEQTAYTPLQIENDAQSYYGLQKRQDFLQTPELGELLGKIQSYVDKPEASSAFVLYGPSGRGKSSLMAQAVDLAERSFAGKTIYRFVGATPHSGSSAEILTSIFDELGINVRGDEEKEETFEDFSGRIYDQILKLEENIVLFIDAVDQLTHDEQFLWLPKTLPSNVKIILSALDDETYAKDSRYFQTLKQKSTKLHMIPPFSNPIGLLKNLLAKEERTLQPHQEDYFLALYATASSPLYVMMAAQEIKHWSSTDTAGEGKDDQKLASGQKGIIEEFLSNLSSLYHHDTQFVHKILGYLYASRDGLSESELLQLISTDVAFVEAMAPETYHDNPTKELPMVHWSRLHTQLKPFLSLKRQDNEELMYFFHREFEDAITSLPGQKEEHKALIQATQKLIAKHQNETFASNRWGKLYATLITEYELRFFTPDEQKQNYELKSTQKRFAQYIARLDNATWIDEFSEHINKIGSDHDKHNRMLKALSYQECDLQLLEALYAHNPDQWAEDYTTALNNLASSYSKQNRVDETIELLKKSLQLLAALYAHNPDQWAEYYTSTLNNLAGSYSKQNRLDEAIKLEKKSLQILKKLYAHNPDRWEENYTIALNYRAASYSKQNRLDKAIKLGEKSLQILESLYIRKPDRWTENYTVALNTLAGSYSKQNRLDEAIKLEEKSLQILEKSYTHNPDRWADNYPAALNYLAGSYSKQNRLDEAIELEEKSLQIREELYVHNPDRWAEDYTWALSSLAVSYYKKNRLNKATELEEKSLQILEDLYAHNPDQWAEDYTRALNNLASSYSEQNRLDEAIKLQEKSLHIREVLYTHKPDWWAENYTRALSNLALSYYKQNRLDEAIELEEKSLQVLEELYAHSRDQWAENYNGTLSNLVFLYSKQNRLDETIELQEKSLRVLEELYTHNPDRWTEDYARALSSLTSSYDKQNHLDEAIELQEKSLQVLEKLYALNPDQWAGYYTLALSKLASSYYNQNRLDEAIELQEKSLHILDELYSHNPDRWAENFTRALSSLAVSYYIQNRLNEAIELGEKSLQIREELYAHNPDRWAEDYARALSTLTSSYYKQNRLDEAIELGEKSLQILEDLYAQNPNRWINKYTSSLSSLASMHARSGEDIKASKYFDIYFKTFDFTQSTDIRSFVYPFIKWYQCEEQLNNHSAIKHLDALANNLKALYQGTLGDAYASIIDDEHKGYIPSRDSEDSVGREKYDIFVKIFLHDEK